METHKHLFAFLTLFAVAGLATCTYVAIHLLSIAPQASEPTVAIPATVLPVGTAVNSFDPLTIQNDDVVGGFRATNVGPVNASLDLSRDQNLEVTFVGTKTLTGVFHDDPHGLFEYTVELSDDSVQELPQMLSSDYLVKTVALREGIRYPVNDGDTVEVTISAFNFRVYPSEGMNSVEVKSIRKIQNNSRVGI